MERIRVVRFMGQDFPVTCGCFLETPGTVGLDT
jgi:hypothetical protein